MLLLMPKAPRKLEEGWEALEGEGCRLNQRAMTYGLGGLRGGRVQDEPEGYDI